MRGGLRNRLILDSARVTILAALEDLGWFDAGRNHLPVRYILRPTHWDDAVEANAFAITSENFTDDELGLGAEMEDTTRCYCDVFGQDESFSLHLASDVRDILTGKMPSIGRNAPFVDVYDFRAATPSAFTTVEVVNVRIDRARNVARTWQEHWWMVRFDLVDDYADEYEGATPQSAWTSDLLPAWQRIQAP